MDIISICVVAVMAAIICVLLRKYNPEYSMIISLVCGILIFILILVSINPLISQIKDLVEESRLPLEYASILFKALGICFLTQFSSDACRDAGESALSSKIELAGKVTIILISLPLFQKITQMAVCLIG